MCFFRIRVQFNTSLLICKRFHISDIFIPYIKLWSSDSIDSFRFKNTKNTDTQQYLCSIFIFKRLTKLLSNHSLMKGDLTIITLNDITGQKILILAIEMCYANALNWEKTHDFFSA